MFWLFSPVVCYSYIRLDQNTSLGLKFFTNLIHILDWIKYNVFSFVWINLSVRIQIIQKIIKLENFYVAIHCLKDYMIIYVYKLSRKTISFSLSILHY